MDLELDLDFAVTALDTKLAPVEQGFSVMGRSHRVGAKNGLITRSTLLKLLKSINTG